jgi:uncharacterized protein
MPAHGGFTWNELMTTDVEQAKRFFGALLGWEYGAMDMGAQGTYTIIQNQGQGAGGMMALADSKAPPGTPPHWVSYVEVDDVDARTSRVEGLGGRVMSVIADPTGAVVCLITTTMPDG